MLYTGNTSLWKARLLRLTSCRNVKESLRKCGALMHLHLLDCGGDNSRVRVALVH